MHMILQRLQLDPDVTIGELSIDGHFECWVCEDTVREDPVGARPVESWKVPGKTAIPYGTYAVQFTPSQRFKRDLPILIAVPGFEGIRIHSGNTAADTEGCLLPGLQRGADGVGQSRAACDFLFAKIDRALKTGEAVAIEITKRGEA